MDSELYTFCGEDTEKSAHYFGSVNPLRSSGATLQANTTVTVESFYLKFTYV